MSHFEKFVTAGNEKADELAKAGAMLDEGFMAEARAETMQQEREEVYAALQYVASFHCLVEQWKDCESSRLSQRKADFRGKGEREYEASNRVACESRLVSMCEMCGSKYMKMQGRCSGPKFVPKSLEE